MKAKTFENLIRKVVREEIDYSLRREIKTLKEDLREELKPTITEHNSKIVESPNKQMPETTKQSLREKIMGNQPLPQNQNFASDNTLNDLLNETARGDTNTQTTNTINDGPLPTEVSNVVNRDYRELMKAIDVKKGK